MTVNYKLKFIFASVRLPVLLNKDQWTVHVWPWFHSHEQWRLPAASPLTLRIAVRNACNWTIIITLDSSGERLTAPPEPYSGRFSNVPHVIPIGSSGFDSGLRSLTPRRGSLAGNCRGPGTQRAAGTTRRSGCHGSVAGSRPFYHTSERASPEQALSGV